MVFHYGKHHKVYVADLNKLVTGTKFADLPLVKLISETTGKTDKTVIFNTTAQIWKHTFYSFFHQIVTYDEWDGCPKYSNPKGLHEEGNEMKYRGVILPALALHAVKLSPTKKPIPFRHIH